MQRKVFKANSLENFSLHVSLNFKLNFFYIYEYIYMNSVKHAVYYKYFDIATCHPNYFICVSDNFFL